ncbi:M1 family metallopeptidase [Lacibacter cauensis]|uniref:M1 family metallopeptidase n=1 Tax=Lacibacter cauensis TaxID=510947 RepID=UPI001F54F65B|nr:M1 family metallopeptidase [Lacibacter cauensis]
MRGSITPGRVWWDVVKYDLAVTPNFDKFTLSGTTVISFRLVKKPGKQMQIDLQDPMIIDSAILNGKKMDFRRDGNAWFIDIPKGRLPKSSKSVNDVHELRIVYHGVPKPALRAPWDGGIVWKKDKNGNPWINVACQGLGASVWWPCKDHQSDEPDNGVTISVTTPDTLMNVSNGRFQNVTNDGNGHKTWTWAVTQPINLYNVTMNVGKYVHFSDTLQGEKGKLDLDYYVLDYNLEKAKKQFEQVKPMLRAFEYWFGPYPFYEDGYKLVESHHLGMEHQSAVAYGNEYMNGYKGNDLSGTGWGKKFDFIIIHESGHEWYGNNISSKDIADMWVHEGFTNYSETLYTDYLYGEEAGNAYLQGIRRNIRNDRPIIGKYNLNNEGSGDMYPKAANMIHMVRQIIGDKSTFRLLLRDMNEKYYHKTVTSAEIEDFMSKRTGYNLSKMFDQYLRTTQVPTLEYYLSTENASQVLYYRWSNCVKGFNMPIRLPGNSNGKYGLMLATENWQRMRTNFNEGEDLGKLMDKNFYVNYKKVK